MKVNSENEVAQLCPTLRDPMDCSPPGSSVHGIFQVRVLEWVAISFSKACMHVKSLQPCPTLCDPMDSSPPGFSVHGDSPGKNTEVSCPPPGDLSNPGIEPRSPTLLVDSL